MEQCRIRQATHGLLVALEDAALLMRRIPRAEIFPASLVGRIWPVVVLLYNILEQALKLLVVVETDDGYVGRKEGRRSEAEKDGHRLSKVFERLPVPAQAALQENYSQFLSMVRCESSGSSGFRHHEFNQLPRYLKALDGDDGKGAIAWRYLWPEQDVLGPELKLPAAHGDVMYEIARHALRVLRLRNETPQEKRQNNWTQDLHSVSFFVDIVEHAKILLGHSDLMSFHSDDDVNGTMTLSDYEDWVRKVGGGVWLNAVLKHRSVGALLQYEKASIRDWAERVVRELVKAGRGDLTGHSGIAFLMDATHNRRVSFDSCKRLFTHGNGRPPNVHDSAPSWMVGWSIQWNVEGAEPLEVPLMIDHRSPLRIPDRKHQVLYVSWRDEHGQGTERPPCEAIKEFQMGTLTMCCEGQEVECMKAIALCVSEYYGGDCWVPPDTDISSLVDEAEPEGVESVRFLRIDAADGWAVRDGACVNKHGEKAYGLMHEGMSADAFSCVACKGTGFCPGCLGVAGDEKGCGLCGSAEKEQGLCSTCGGHGCVGDMLIKRHVQPRQG